MGQALGPVTSTLGSARLHPRLGSTRLGSVRFVPTLGSVAPEPRRPADRGEESSSLALNISRGFSAPCLGFQRPKPAPEDSDQGASEVLPGEAKRRARMHAPVSHPGPRQPQPVNPVKGSAGRCMPRCVKNAPWADACGDASRMPPGQMHVAMRQGCSLGRCMRRCALDAPGRRRGRRWAESAYWGRRHGRMGEGCPAREGCPAGESMRRRETKSSEGDTMGRGANPGRGEFGARHLQGSHHPTELAGGSGAPG